MTEDEKWIRMYQAGDKRGRDQLLEKYYQYIFKTFCYKLLNSKDAEDFTQDICLKLIINLKNFKFDSKFKTYLDRMINNKLIDYYRKKGKWKIISIFVRTDEDEEDQSFLQILLSDMESPDESLKVGELKKIIDQCLALLKNINMKQLVKLWFDGITDGTCMTREDMTEYLDKSIGYVNGTLERGKKLFRNCIREKYVIA